MGLWKYAFVSLQRICRLLDIKLVKQGDNTNDRLADRTKEGCYRFDDDQIVGICDCRYIRDGHLSRHKVSGDHLDCHKLAGTHVPTILWCSAQFWSATVNILLVILTIGHKKQWQAKIVTLCMYIATDFSSTCNCYWWAAMISPPPVFLCISSHLFYFPITPFPSCLPLYRFSFSFYHFYLSSILIIRISSINLQTSRHL